MKLLTRLLLNNLIIYFILGCSTPNSFFIPEKPLSAKSVVVGAVLVENTGIDDLYESKRKNINVIIVGKPIEGEDEKAEGYRLKTDENGYFAVQNVTPGAYILKGIEVDIGYANRRIISSRWEGNRQIFINEGVMVDFIVRNWPEAVDKKVIDMGIHYFKLDNAGRILHKQFEELKNTRLFLENKMYIMPKPSKYYKEKFPLSEWFD